MTPPIPVWLRCPSCAHHWLGAIVTSWDETSPAACAKRPYCPRCGQAPPMLIETRATKGAAA